MPFEIGSFDESNIYAQTYGMYISFRHIPTDKVAKFKAFITDFKDQYTSDWNDTTVYGRMDPISTFQGTRRNISFSFDVVAASFDEAKYNFENSRRLIQFLYPVYERTAVNSSFSATSMVAAPLLAIRFGNLIRNAGHLGQGAIGNEAQELVGKLDGITYDPDFEVGVFHHPEEGGAGVVFPKVNRFSCNYTVFHTHDLGFDINGASNSDFPYAGTTGFEETDSIEEFETVLGNIASNTLEQAQAAVAEEEITGAERVRRGSREFFSRFDPLKPGTSAEFPMLTWAASSIPRSGGE